MNLIFQVTNLCSCQKLGREDMHDRNRNGQTPRRRPHRNPEHYNLAKVHSLYSTGNLEGWTGIKFSISL